MIVSRLLREWLQEFFQRRLFCNDQLFEIQSCADQYPWGNTRENERQEDTPQDSRGNLPILWRGISTERIWYMVANRERDKTSGFGTLGYSRCDRNCWASKVFRAVDNFQILQDSNPCDIKHGHPFHWHSLRIVYNPAKQRISCKLIFQLFFAEMQNKLIASSIFPKSVSMSIIYRVYKKLNKLSQSYTVEI